MDYSNRPLSPHLQVYRPQLTSLLSILHRMTGMAITLGVVILVLWLMALAHSLEWFLYLKTFLQHPFGLFILMGLSFSYFFHLSNGIRHLIWDSGHGYDLKSVYKSGYFALAFTLIATVLLWVIVFNYH